MDSVLTRVTEGLEKGSAALGGIINDLQCTGEVSGDTDIGRQMSQRQRVSWAEGGLRATLPGDS